MVEVEQLQTHGGSLRIWLAHQGQVDAADSVVQVLAMEEAAGLETCEAYLGFQQRAEQVKFGLLDFLLTAKQKGEHVIGYGAAAKGNTLMNYAGVRADLLPMVVDNAISKQGKYLPGSHIPVVGSEVLDSCKPDLVLVLPWNLIRELRAILPSYCLITAVPEIRYWAKPQVGESQHSV